MKVVLLAEAEAELDDAASWYDEGREGLGDELLRAVREALLVISEAPESWPRWPNARADSTAAPLPAAAVSVCDRLPVHADFVSVLGIVHGKRKPLYWVGRSSS